MFTLVILGVVACSTTTIALAIKAIRDERRSARLVARINDYS